MPTTLIGSLTHYWAQRLDYAFRHPDLHYLGLQVKHCRNDARNEHDGRITRASLHIDAISPTTAPAIIGLITTCPPDDEDDDDDAAGVLAQEVFDEQIQPLRSAGPFFCFVAHGTSNLTMWACEYSNAGRDPSAPRLIYQQAWARNPTRGEIEQEGVLRHLLMDAIVANLALPARSAIRVM